MAGKVTPGSAKAQGRQGAKTDLQVTSPSDFAKAIAELDGDCESKNMLLYGDSGCGKTVVAGSAPNSLILACEPGYISAAPNRWDLPLGKREVRPIPNSSVLLGGLDWLEAGGHKKYQWVILEGASTLDKKVRLNFAAEAFDHNPQARVHRNLPMEADYFNTQNYMIGVISRLIDLPVNVLITAHSMTMDDDEGNVRVMPEFQKKGGGLSNYVSGLCHAVGYMRKRSFEDKKTKKIREVRRILWQQWVDPKTETVYFAKDQFDAFGRYTDDTNIFELMAMIGPGETEE